jgi:hypothetical protein
MLGSCLPPESDIVFNDLFHLVDLLDHDYREENGRLVHSYTCRRCEIALRLKSFREKIRRLLHDVDFDVGDPVEEKRTNSKDSPETPASKDRN